ncbi:acyltransferase [Rhodobacter sp. CZR27]|uniref:acyltransferase family protein n=1 Tax=Rhodobacter sp. CZR27 TaxID=2033869 RepID=UPI0012FD11CD|nr:acyltransferase [Rhodobacter sp. CZR27]
MSIASPAAQTIARLDTLQAGRGIAAVYVVLFHARLITDERLGVEVSNRFIEAGHAGVEFFFVLSGFIIFHIHRKDLGRPDQLWGYLRNRLVRIYPMFWIVFAMFVAGQAASGQIDKLLSGAINIARAILLVPFDGLPPMTVAWTLSHELLFYCLFALAICSPRIGWMVLAAWWTVCTALIPLSMAMGVSPIFPQSFFFSPYNLLFLVGICAASYSSHLPASALLCGGLFGGGLLLFSVIILLEPQLHDTVTVVLYGLGAGAMILAAVRAEELRLVRVTRLMTFLGDASYSIYLLHSIAIILATMIVGHLGLAAVLPPLGTALLMAFAGVVAGSLFHVTVEREMMKAFRRKHRLNAVST